MSIFRTNFIRTVYLSDISEEKSETGVLKIACRMTPLCFLPNEKGLMVPHVATSPSYPSKSVVAYNDIAKLLLENRGKKQMYRVWYSTGFELTDDEEYVGYALISKVEIVKECVFARTDYRISNDQTSEEYEKSLCDTALSGLVLYRSWNPEPKETFREICIKSKNLKRVIALSGFGAVALSLATNILSVIM